MVEQEEKMRQTMRLLWAYLISNVPDEIYDVEVIRCIAAGHVDELLFDTSFFATSFIVPQISLHKEVQSHLNSFDPTTFDDVQLENFLLELSFHHSD